MMTESNFYKPDEIMPMYDEISIAYQTAFADEPWYEVSKCADKLQRCIGGLSAVALGQTCQVCFEKTTLPAYERQELIDKFENLALSRPTAWYIESEDDKLGLAAVAWRTEVQTIAREKYEDVPAMASWLDKTLGAEPIVWLDEVFASRALRRTGNLRRFRAMNDGFMDQLGSDTIAFRTINERMVAAAERDFESQATIFRNYVDVPDRREFVVITKK